MGTVIYRREIDGLRAFAVLPVILFHAGFAGFGGGYVGVDVFFVISGYLISSIILSAAEEGRFSIAKFYERRARRILPALLVVMAACLPLGWFLMLPQDLLSLGKSSIAVMLFVSNVFFWRTSNYFGDASDRNPLLHTWSLSVEEQYYVVFPLVLVALLRFGRRATVVAIAATALASLLLAQWLVNYRPSAAFYLLPTRAWELLLGVLATFVLAWNGPDRLPAAVRDLLSAAGLAAIGVSVMAYDRNTPFPSAYALLPTVGTLLLILFCTADTRTGRFLGNRVLVGVGLISYSLYLWHQPLLAFGRIATGAELELPVALALIVASVALAYATWRYVETPFRTARQVRGRVAVPLGGFATVCILFFSSGALSSSGYADRYPALKPYLESAVWPEANNLSPDCVRRFGGDQFCLVHDASRPVTDALIGDSHANHFYPGLSAALAAQGRNLLMQAAGACPPFLGIDLGKHPLHGYLRCEARMGAPYRAILADRSIRTVYLAFHHSDYFRPDVSFVDARGEILPSVQKPAAVRAALVRTIREFEAAGKRVVLIYDMPDLKTGEPLACIRRSEQDASACRAENVFVRDYADYDAAVAAARVATNVELFDTRKYWADFPRSPAGEWLYRDPTHLSQRGSMYFANKFD